ncbi:YheC/YheD family protein [Evansella sp. AB-P1]|uniref:YheC/YheD family endospore coat-associated protein n=1 Tax=Evansella sp. AB-P1 TaxID=3037653 RepID=UPI00241ED724|nr:YheC/YheD family protein [Evansella sp. AB-P1]MDG5786386.1 YheC/YheD family protein [Evansella sp. AB-P1]
MLSFTFYINNMEISHYIKTNQVIIPKKVASLWNIQSPMTATMCNHILSMSVEVVVDPLLDDSTMKLQSTVFSKLAIPKQERIQCIYDSANMKFHLGPTVGVVLGDIRTDIEEPFGIITPYIKEMAKQASKLFIPFFVFSYKNVNGSFVDGFVLRDNKWCEENFLLPQVIYNRIGRRDQEFSTRGQNFFNLLKEFHIPYFNDQFIHKWKTFTFFYNEPILQPYIPETRHLRSKKDLLDMFERYTSIYLKPFWGKEGSGIILIEKQSENRYLITYPQDSDWETKISTSLNELLMLLKDRINRRLYLVQQKIYTKEIFDSAIDFRILCIKNHRGYWETCSSIARIGQKNKIVSNLSQGGTQKKSIDVLENLMSKNEALQMDRLLRELALQCANVIDQEASGIYGELGFDFMVDNRNRVWILEVNIKPSKSEFRQMEGKTPPSIIQILLFAASLTHF